MCFSAQHSVTQPLTTKCLSANGFGPGIEVKLRIGWVRNSSDVVSSCNGSSTAPQHSAQGKKSDDG